MNKKPFARLSLTVGTLLACAFLIQGCGSSDTSPKDDITAASDETAADTAGEKDKPSKPKASDSKEKEEKQSFAKRLCGKYGLKCECGDIHSLCIYEFGDNLYAYAGDVIDEEDTDVLTTYSYWAMEMIPDRAEDVRSKYGDECEVSLFCFSNMSNAGLYWDATDSGTIRLTDNGIVFEDFEISGPFCGKVQGRKFTKDDRAEDAFMFMSDEQKRGGGDLCGLWRTVGEEYPLYIDFINDRDIRIYDKKPGREVVFMCGSYEDDGKDTISCRTTQLGCGGMPIECSFKYSMNKDRFIFEPDTDLGSILEISGVKELEKADWKDVNIITTADMQTADTGTGDSAFTGLDGGFYGVWIKAFKNSDEAWELQDKLAMAGYTDSEVVYTSDWEKLNKEGYFSVTACLADSQEAAEEILAKIKADGYSDAYVKHSGKRLEHRINYTMFSESALESEGGKVLIKDVMVDEFTGGASFTKTLIVDDKTVFDPSCDMEFFGNYEEGDSPLDWLNKNIEYAKRDYDAYSMYGPALIGVFDVTITGDHIDRFYGSYWWD